MPSPTSVRGDGGEQIAVTFLEKQGYRILARNYRCRLGEIDIVAEEGDVLCFVEVRSCRTMDFGGPLATVRRGKQGRLIRTARSYIARHLCGEREMRFDVVGITYEPSLAIDLVRGAFEVPSSW